ncbi:MAG TPA: glycosyltransferase family 1 protein [Verrucomicrobiae bacterium]|nr:glycosyltransferase family 1 protein [Verrucomicrobiae bacterium]
MSAKKVWIDISDISVWAGYHTGTQRVVYQIAKRYRGQPNVDYFVFNPRSNTFHQHSFDEVIQRVEAAAQEAEAGAPPPKPSKSIRARVMVARVYQNSPEAVRKRLTPERRTLIKRVLKKAKRTMRPPQPAVATPTTPAMRFGADDIVLITGKAWDYRSFMEALRKDKLDQHFKIIQVVYDLIPIFFPHLFGLPLFKPYTQHMFEVGALSDGLLAISESSKRDMLNYCKGMLIPPPPIDVIRLGDDFAKVEPVKPGIKSLKPGNFILCCGTVEVRKNHQLLYTAYKEGFRRGLKLPKLVVVGGKGWYTGDVMYQFTHDPAFRDMVYIGGRSDQELEWLYQNCLLTVYPSVYEGWGLPIAESLAHGKLCLASDTSSMTEIAGDLIEYFSPYDTVGCLELLQKYMDKPTLAKKEAQIQKTYQPVAWDHTFTQVKKFVDKM